MQPIETTFTLSQIVEYAKTRVAWEDARPIVGMLNMLLRGCASREDIKQVDSIEAEFLNRMMVGIQVKNAEIEVKGSGNYIAHNITKK